MHIELASVYCRYSCTMPMLRTAVKDAAWNELSSLHNSRTAAGAPLGVCELVSINDSNFSALRCADTMDVCIGPHTLFSISVPIHIHDMVMLHERHPDIASEAWCVQLSKSILGDSFWPCMHMKTKTIKGDGRAVSLVWGWLKNLRSIPWMAALIQAI